MKLSFSHIIVTVLVLCTMAPLSYASLADVETAVLNRNYTEAKRRAEEILATDHSKKSDAQKAQYYIGLSQLGQAQYKEALESFNKMRNEELEPQLRERVYLGIFDAYYLQEQYDDADVIIREFLQEGPKPKALSLVYLKLAKVNLKLAQWDQATGYLEKIVRSFPNSLEVPAANQLLAEKHYFAVQVGAFTERRLAEALVDELKQKEEYAYIVESVDPQNNRKYYRVRVGQLSMVKEAQTLKNRLAKLGYPTQIYP